MILVRYIRDFFYFIPTIIIGWIRVFIIFSKYLFASWKKFPFTVRLATFVFFGQLVFATRPWFEYRIRFYEADEILFVSSKINLIFIFLSLVNCIFLFTNISFSKGIISILQIIMGILFLIGFLTPTSIHIDFINQNDYGFAMNFYVFSVFLLLAISFSIYNYFNKEQST
ncbi:MAG: hypothetical protein IPL26_01265 [Leptospiraceae bacterium]|nr:hypothetical protein [Leptospiraceae bacterium]